MKPQTNGTTGPPGAREYDNGWNFPGIAKSTRFLYIFAALKGGK